MKIRLKKWFEVVYCWWWDIRDKHLPMFLFRIRRLFCYLGFHKLDWTWRSGKNSRGTDNGEMTFCCKYCLKPLNTIAFDDVPEKIRNMWLEVWKEDED